MHSDAVGQIIPQITCSDTESSTTSRVVLYQSSIYIVDRMNEYNLPRREQ